MHDSIHASSNLHLNHAKIDWFFELHGGGVFRIILGLQVYDMAPQYFDRIRYRTSAITVYPEKRTPLQWANEENAKHLSSDRQVKLSHSFVSDIIHDDKTRVPAKPAKSMKADFLTKVVRFRPV